MQLGVRGWKPGGAEGGSWLPGASQSSKIDGLTDSWQKAAWGHSCVSKYVKWAQANYGPGVGKPGSRGGVAEDGVKRHEFGATMPGQA